MGLLIKSISDTEGRQLCMIRNLKKVYDPPPEKIHGGRPYTLNISHPCCGV